MVFYFVQRGETLFSIARRYQTTVHAIVAANRLEDPNAICPGQALIIPKPGEVPSPPPGGIVHLVRPGETVFHLSQKFGTQPAEILRANQIAHPEFILPGQQLVIPERLEAGDEWPMQGRTAGRGAASPVGLGGQPQPSWSCGPRHPGGSLPSPPVIRYDRIFAGLGDGAYYAVEKGSGRIKWRLALEGESGRPLPAPAVFDGIVYLAGPEGTVLAVDAYRGTPIWRTATDGQASAGLAVAGGVVYAGSRAGVLHALEAKTGALVWKRELQGPVGLPVAVGDERVYAMDDAGVLWCLDAFSGDVGWQQAVAGGPAAAPVFAELVVLVGGRAFDPQTGQELWAVAEQAPPVVRAETLFYPGGAVDLFSGDYRWRTAGVGAPPVPLAGAGNLVLALTPDGDLAAFRAEDGQPAWRVGLGAPACHPPAVAPGLLAVALADGTLRAVKVRPERGSRSQEREHREQS